MRSENERGRVAIRRFFHNFGDLYHYREANAQLGAPAEGERRVVFFGDSITEFWDLEASFPGLGYVNRGIRAQTTSQLLLRFRQDVVELRPAVVAILGGTNDLAGNTGPTTMDEITGNLATMAELARVHGIRAVLGSVTPVHRASLAALKFAVLRPVDKIAALNAWLRNYCAEEGLGLADYYSAMADAQGMMRKELADDGLHPNAAGYAVMAPLARKAVAHALGQPTEV